MRRRTRTAAAAAAVGPDDELTALVAALPPQQRLALSLYYFADLSVAEVADAMQLSTGAVKYHLHAARTSLARSLWSPAMSADEPLIPDDDAVADAARRRARQARTLRPAGADGAWSEVQAAARRVQRRRLAVASAAMRDPSWAGPASPRRSPTLEAAADPCTSRGAGSTTSSEPIPFDHRRPSRRPRPHRCTVVPADGP